MKPEKSFFVYKPKYPTFMQYKQSRRGFVLKSFFASIITLISCFSFFKSSRLSNKKIYNDANKFEGAEDNVKLGGRIKIPNLIKKSE